MTYGKNLKITKYGEYKVSEGQKRYVTTVTPLFYLLHHILSSDLSVSSASHRGLTQKPNHKHHQPP